MTKNRKHLPKVVKAALRRQTVTGEIRQPDLAKLVTHFFHQAGGEREVAKMLYREFVDAQEGSIVRQRILDMVLRALKFTNEQDPPEDDLGILSDADLDRELNEIVGELSDGSEATNPAPAPATTAGLAEAPAPGTPGPDRPAAGSTPGGDGPRPASHPAADPVATREPSV